MHAFRSSLAGLCLNFLQLDQLSEFGELPARESPGYEGNAPVQPEPAWYNREDVYDDDNDEMERSRSGVGRENSFTDRESPGKYYKANTLSQQGCLFFA